MDAIVQWINETWPVTGFGLCVIVGVLFYYVWRDLVDSFCKDLEL
jgi:hypothetical protein